jgi:hypothetical protein
MTVKTETLHAGSFIESEANGTRSRERITVLSGQNLLAGAVLGAVLAGATGNAVAFAGNTGNGAMGAITVTGPAKNGDYKLIIIEPATNAGVFQVEDPDGLFVGKGSVAAAFSAGGLAFTLADGATDFVAGDGFTITVSGGTSKYKKYENAAVDGSQIAVAVLWDDVDASAADKAGVAIVRNAEVKNAALVWDAGQSAGDKAAGLVDLAKRGIIAR